MAVRNFHDPKGFRETEVLLYSRNIFYWVLRFFQEYFTYIKSIVHQKWVKTSVQGEKPSDLP